jgi:radical SAM enzyme (rSAM/lipoprotein system)
MSILRPLLYPVYRRLETIVHPLRYLFIEITQRCNLNCRHCGSDCSRETHLDELSTTEWLNFFGYLKDHTDTRKLVLVITGGEPFCHPQFDRILDGLKKNGLAWGMVTNGLALTRSNVERVVEHDISSVTVSLDGLQPSHDWLRGRAGSFAKAVSGLEYLSQIGLGLYDVVTCVHPGNIEELPKVHKLLEELNVPGWRLFSIFPKGRARKNKELLLDREGFRRLLDFIRVTRTEANSNSMAVNLSCEGYLPGNIDHLVRDEPYFCRAGISIGSVLCDGAISACPNISRSLVQGNIRSHDFVDVWENRFQPFRDRNWMKKGPCVDCNQWKRCLGNSMHLWDEELGHTALCTYRDESNRFG